jgi:hypothetical protein
MENPVKSPFSVHMENKPFNRPDCQNTAGMHLTYWPLMVIKLRQNRPRSLARPGPETLPECEYEGHFFDDCVGKKESG